MGIVQWKLVAVVAGLAFASAAAPEKSSLPAQVSSFNEEALKGQLNAAEFKKVQSQPDSVVVTAPVYHGKVDYAPQDCCSPHLEAGCSSKTVSAKVCELDSYCCSKMWDGVCVDVMKLNKISFCVSDKVPKSGIAFGHADNEEDAKALLSQLEKP